MSATETTGTHTASPASVESAPFRAAPRSGWIEHWTPENPDFWEATGKAVARRNLIFSNYYSGLRQVGNAFSGISVSQNTFFHNGTGSSNAGRSEANLDDTGAGAKTVYSKNILAASNKILNNCYDAASRGYSIADNWVQGSLPSPTNCIGAMTSGDPLFLSSTDLHPQSTAAQAYGAYSK